jgi:putative ATPase
MKSRAKPVPVKAEQMADSQQRPLADRLRPQSLDEFVGQKHLTAAGKPLYQVIATNKVYSMIFWGPPGVGKTTLARLIARHTGRQFYELSAVSAGKDEIRAIVQQSRRERGETRDMFSLITPAEPSPSPILFLDEIHRFNKAQQDFLLPFVEDGTLTLIGATTENPSFEVIPALLSRARVFVLEVLSEADIRLILEHGASVLGITIQPEALDFLVNYADGDARQSLNLLEVACELYAAHSNNMLTVEHLRDAVQSKHLRYDNLGEEHYNTISAFIKSMRASKVDAALYYLARMVAAGEDPLFIARRMIIFASEDVGIADPQALTLANAVFRACEVIGYPEAQINLAHGAVYLAQAPKSRASCDSFFRALEDTQQHGSLPIPMELRNAPTKLMKELGYGKREQHGETDLLPNALRGMRYYAE